jgi:hypothetical protein
VHSLCNVSVSRRSMPCCWLLSTSFEWSWSNSGLQHSSDDRLRVLCVSECVKRRRGGKGPGEKEVGGTGRVGTALMHRVLGCGVCTRSSVHETGCAFVVSWSARASWAMAPASWSPSAPRRQGQPHLVWHPATQGTPQTPHEGQSSRLLATPSILR